MPFPLSLCAAEATGLAANADDDAANEAATNNPTGDATDNPIGGTAGETEEDVSERIDRGESHQRGHLCVLSHALIKNCRRKRARTQSEK